MCDDSLLPDSVAKALADYRGLRDRHGPTWGEEPIGYVVQAWATVFLDRRYPYWASGLRQMAERFPDLPPEELEDRLGEVDVDRVVRDALDGDVLGHLAALRLTPAGAALEARTQVVLGDAPFRTALLLDSSRDEAATVVVDGVAYDVAAGGAAVVAVTREVIADGRPVDLSPLSRRAAAATVRLRAGFPCRWSVTGAGGQGWYPEGAPAKVDGLLRPYFHGDDVLLAVPAEEITVEVTRGMEYATAEVRLTPAAGQETLVELTPERLYDAAARGWYGGDMHVHLNWMGEEPAAQHGEDLHVLNLVAGNVAGAHVARQEDVRWCLDWLDRLESVVREFGRFDAEQQYDDHLELYERARNVYRSRLARS